MSSIKRDIKKKSSASTGGREDLMSPRSWVVLIVLFLGIAAISLRVLESDRERASRAARKIKKDLLSLTAKISAYGQSVHRRYPTGDVVDSERDLADQLRKRPEAIVTALNLLLNERRVQGLL
jgi:hypothetical protein